MKYYLPVLLVALFTISCTTAYKSGQTPDDVYYSPERPVDEYVQVERNSDRQYRNDRFDTYDDRDDRVVRMRLRNRLFSTLEDDWYLHDTYFRHRNNFMNYYSPMNYVYFWNYNFNPYFSPHWNNYYSPYGPGTIHITPRNVYNKPRTYNLLVFDKEVNNTHPNLPKGNRAGNVGYRDNTESYRGSGSSAGDYLRGVFNSGGSSNVNTKTSTMGSSGTSGSSSSGSSSSGSSSSGSGSTRGNATRGGN